MFSVFASFICTCHASLEDVHLVHRVSCLVSHGFVDRDVCQSSLVSENLSGVLVLAICLLLTGVRAFLFFFFFFLVYHSLNCQHDEVQLPFQNKFLLLKSV